jgi:hypothetical protein
VGLASSTIVFSHELVKQLSGLISPEQLRSLQQSLTTLSILTASEQAAVAKVVDTSFNKQMRICLYVSVVNVLISLTTYSWKKGASTAIDSNNETTDAREQEPGHE